MVAKSSSVSFFAGLFAVLLLSGCGSSGPEQVNVTGTLNYKGKPVEEGALELVPTSGGPMQPISVKDGKFSATGEYGVIVGDYKVIFHAYDVRANKNPEQAGGDIPEMRPKVELLPKNYSSEASTETLSLKSGEGSKTLTFDLK